MRSFFVLFCSYQNQFGSCINSLIEGECQINLDTFPVIMTVTNKQIVLLQSTCRLENALLNKATWYVQYNICTDCTLTNPCHGIWIIIKKKHYYLCCDWNWQGRARLHLQSMVCTQIQQGTLLH